MAGEGAHIDLETVRAVTTAAAKELTSPPRRSAALTYLRQRGIDPRTLDHWPLGYAPPGWTRLVQALRADFPDEALVGAGVAARSSRGSLIDTFRDRVIFPVHASDGQVAGFVGRDLSSSPGAPKYLNTRRTELFAKSELLYGLHERRAGQLVVVEGPVDVLALAARNAELRPVSACGTALTAAHARILGQSGDRIVVALDADSAGRSAALRASQTLRAGGLDVRLAVLPTGLDPADYLAQPTSRPDAFTYDAAEPLLTAQVLQRIADQGDRMQWIEGKLAATRAVARDLTAYPVATVAAQIGWIADVLDLDPATVTAEFAEAFRTAPGPSGASLAPSGHELIAR